MTPGMAWINRHDHFDIFGVNWHDQGPSAEECRGILLTDFVCHLGGRHDTGDEIIRGNHDSSLNSAGLTAVPCFHLINSSRYLSKPAPISEQKLYGPSGLSSSVVSLGRHVPADFCNHTGGVTSRGQ